MNLKVSCSKLNVLFVMFILIFLTVMILSETGYAAGSNLLPTTGAARYDFEAVGATWYEWGTTANITNSTAFAHSGSRSCKFTDLTSSYGNREIASETESVTANRYYKGSIWAYIPALSSASEVNFQIRLRWYNGNTYVSENIENGITISAEDTWEQITTARYQAPATATQARVCIAALETNNLNYDPYIDDGSLYSDNIPSAPAPFYPLWETSGSSKDHWANTSTILVEFTHSDYDGDAQSAYQVQLDNNSDFSSVNYDSNKTSSSNDYHWFTGISGDTYYWRVKTWDSDDNAGSWRTVTSEEFHVDYTFPVDFEDETVRRTSGWVAIANWTDSSSPGVDCQVYDYVSGIKKADHAFSDSGLVVGHWSMDPEEGNVSDYIYDQSFNRNHGTGYNLTWGEDNGFDAYEGYGSQIGSCQQFNGSNAYISIPDDNTLDLTGDLTIEMWLYPSATQNAYANILRKETGGNGYGIEMNSTANSNSYVFGWKNSSTSYGWTQEFSLTANTWNYLAITKSGAEATIYVNGDSVQNFTAASATIGTNGAALEIGNWTGAATREWNGRIDEVRIMRTVRSAKEISLYYNNGCQYKYSTDGGSSWSDWQEGSISSGNDGSIGARLLAPNVPFNQTSADQNQIKFRVMDVAGNIGVGPAVTIKVDLSAPDTVTDLGFSTTGSSTVALNWSAIPDDGYSGWSKYEIYYKAGTEPTTSSYTGIWDTGDDGNLATRTTVTTTVTGLTADTTYYFKIRGVDAAGNAGALSSNSCKVVTDASSNLLTNGGFEGGEWGNKWNNCARVSGWGWEKSGTYMFAFQGWFTGENQGDYQDVLGEPNYYYVFTGYANKEATFSADNFYMKLEFHDSSLTQISKTESDILSSLDNTWNNQFTQAKIAPPQTVYVRPVWEAINTISGGAIGVDDCVLVRRPVKVFVMGTHNDWNYNYDNALLSDNMPSGFVKKTITPSVDGEFKIFKYDGTNWGNNSQVNAGDINTKITLGANGGNAIWKSVPQTYMTVVAKDTANVDGNIGVLATSAIPISIVSVSGATDTRTMGDSSSDITITLSGSKCPQENVWVVYAKDTGSGPDWTNRDTVPASGSGTTYSCSIPAQTEGCTIFWYAITTTATSLPATKSDIDYLTLSGDFNGGDNYSYRVLVPPDTPGSRLPTGGAPQNDLTPTISWTYSGTGNQSNYQIQVDTYTGHTGWDGVLAWDSTKTAGSSSSVSCGATLSRRTLYCWRARVWDSDGETGPWSDGTDTFWVNRIIVDGNGNDWWGPDCPDTDYNSSYTEPSVSDNEDSVSSGGKYFWQDSNSDERESGMNTEGNQWYAMDKFTVCADTMNLYIKMDMEDMSNDVNQGSLIEITLDYADTGQADLQGNVGGDYAKVSTSVVWQHLIKLNNRGTEDTCTVFDSCFVETNKTTLYYEDNTNNQMEAAVAWSEIGGRESYLGQAVNITVSVFRHDETANKFQYHYSDVEGPNATDCMSKTTYTYTSGADPAITEFHPNDYVLNAFSTLSFSNNSADNRAGDITTSTAYSGKSIDGQLGDWANFEVMENDNNSTAYLSFNDDYVYVGIDNADLSGDSDLVIAFDIYDTGGVRSGLYGAEFQEPMLPDFIVVAVAANDADFYADDNNDGTWDAKQEPITGPNPGDKATGWDLYSGWANNKTTEIRIPRTWLGSSNFTASDSMAVFIWIADVTNTQITNAYPLTNPEGAYGKKFLGAYYYPLTPATALPDSAVEQPPTVEITDITNPDSASPLGEVNATEAKPNFYKGADLTSFTFTSTITDDSGIIDSGVLIKWDSTEDAEDQIDTDPDEDGDSTIGGTADSTEDDTVVFVVTARDHYGNISADTIYLWLDNTNPTIPTLLTPLNGDSTTSNTVNFDWSDASDTASGVHYYSIQIARDTGFNSIMVDSIVYSSDSAIVLPDSYYFWRVGAYDYVGNFSGYTSTGDSKFVVMRPCTTYPDLIWTETAGVQLYPGIQYSIATKYSIGYGFGYDSMDTIELGLYNYDVYGASAVTPSWHVAVSGDSGNGDVTIDSGTQYCSGTPTYVYTAKDEDIYCTYSFVLTSEWPDYASVEYAVRCWNDVGLPSNSGAWAYGDSNINFVNEATGTAAINPTIAPRLYYEEYDITFTAEYLMSGGTVSVTIPANWTAPQQGDETGEGYTSVSSSQSASIADITGQVITVSLGTWFDAGDTIRVAYGDRASGGPGSSTTSSSGTTDDFTVKSCGAGGSLTTLTNSTSPQVTIREEWQGTEVAAYNFNGDADDLVNGTNDGTLSNMDSTNYKYGRFGQALEFNGSDESVTLPEDDSDFDASTALTIEAWIEPDVLTGSRMIVGKSNAYFFWILDDSLRFEIYDGSGWNGQCTLSSLSSYISANQWSHVAAVFDGSTDEMKLYINGVMVKSSTYEDDIATNNNQVGIGDAPGWGRFFDGKIDEVKIYTSVYRPNPTRYYPDPYDIVISGVSGDNGSIWDGSFIEVYNRSRYSLSVNGFDVIGGGIGAATWGAVSIGGGEYYLFGEVATIDGAARDQVCGNLPENASANCWAQFRNASDAEIDCIGFDGTATNKEGTADDGANDAAFIRGSLTSNTWTSGYGNFYDSDDNSANFKDQYLASNYAVHNSSSTAETIGIQLYASVPIIDNGNPFDLTITAVKPNGDTATGITGMDVYFCVDAGTISIGSATLTNGTVEVNDVVIAHLGSVKLRAWLKDIGYIYGEKTWNIQDVDLTDPIIQTITFSSDKSGFFYHPTGTIDTNVQGGISGIVSDTVWFNSVNGEGGGQIVSVTVVSKESHPDTLTGTNVFTYSGDDGNNANNQNCTYTIANGATSQNITFTVYDESNNDDSVTIAFIGDNNDPETPVLTSPADDSYLDSAQPTLVWTAPSETQAGIAYYKVQIDTESTFAGDLIINDTTTETHYTPPEFDAGLYYWHVTAVDSAGNWGDTASADSFTLRIIYSETFPYANNTTDPGNGKWSITGQGAGYFKTVSNVLQTNNVNTAQSMITQTIDISDFSNVSLSVDVAEAGTCEAADYARVYYSIDGWPYQYFDVNYNNTGDFTSATAYTPNLNGDTVVIKVSLLDSAADEWHKIDNVSCTGTYNNDANTPSTPADFAVAKLYSEAVKFSWTAATESEFTFPESAFRSYVIYVSDDATVNSSDTEWCKREEFDLRYRTSVVGTVSGLKPNTTYYAEIACVDQAGNTSPLSSTGVSFTTPSSPKLRLNEILAQPAAGLGDTAEYVEIYNYGTGNADLDGYVIYDTSGPGYKDTVVAWNVRFPNTAVVDDSADPDTTTSVLKPGWYAVVIDPDYDTTIYDFPDNCIILTVAKTNSVGYSGVGSSGLTNDGDLVKLCEPGSITPIDQYEWNVASGEDESFEYANGAFEDNGSRSPGGISSGENSAHITSVELSSYSLNSMNVEQGMTNLTVFSIAVPDNAGAPDTFAGARIVNNGTCNQDDISAMKVWYDVNQNRTYDVGDSLVGTLTYDATIDEWKNESLSCSLPVSGHYFVFTIDVASDAVNNETFQAQLPLGCGVMVASGFHGPSVAAVTSDRVVTFKTADTPVIYTINMTSDNDTYFHYQGIDTTIPTGDTVWYNSESGGGLNQQVTVTVTWNDVMMDSAYFSALFNQTAGYDQSGDTERVFTIDDSDTWDTVLTITVYDQIGNDSWAKIHFVKDNSTNNTAGPDDLSAADSTSVTVSCTWTAFTSDPDEDTGAGFGQYVIFYSETTPVTTSDNSWDSSNNMYLADMSTDSVTISGLKPNTMYYFNIAWKDKVGNLSSLGGEMNTLTGIPGIIKFDFAASPSDSFYMDAPVDTAVGEDLFGDTVWFSNNQSISLDVGVTWVDDPGNDTLFASPAFGSALQTQTGNDANDTVSFTIQTSVAADTRVTFSVINQDGAGCTVILGFQRDIQAPESITGYWSESSDYMYADSETLYFSSKLLTTPANATCTGTSEDAGVGLWKAEFQGALGSTPDTDATPETYSGVYELSSADAGTGDSSVLVVVYDYLNNYAAKKLYVIEDITAKGPITGVDSTNVQASRATIEWNAYSGLDWDTQSGFREYRVYYGTSSPLGADSSSWTTANDANLNDSTVDSTTITGLTASETYYFSVVWIDNCGNISALSAEDVFLTPYDNDSTNIRINEIVGDPLADIFGLGGGDAVDEYVELYNEGADSVNIANWTLTDKDNHSITFPANTYIPGYGWCLVHAGSDKTIYIYDSTCDTYDVSKSWTGTWGTNTAYFGFVNGGDTCILKSNGGTEIDTVVWIPQEGKAYAREVDGIDVWKQTGTLTPGWRGAGAYHKKSANASLTITGPGSGVANGEKFNLSIIIKNMENLTVEEFGDTPSKHIVSLSISSGSVSPSEIAFKASYDGETTADHVYISGANTGDQILTVAYKSISGTCTVNIINPHVVITAPSNGHDTTVSPVVIRGTGVGANEGDSIIIYVNNVASETVPLTSNTWVGTVSLTGDGDSIAVKLTRSDVSVSDWDTITINYNGIPATINLKTPVNNSSPEDESETATYGRSLSLRPHLVWSCPNDGDSDNLFFTVHVDTGSGFTIIGNSADDVTGFTYYDGSSFDTVPANGVDSTNVGNTVCYKPQINLKVGSCTWLVLAHDESDTSDSPTAYHFRIETRNWTDSDITEGATLIRVVHITELWEEINYARNLRGLADTIWIDSPLTAGSSLIRKAHIDQMRAAIEEIAGSVGEDAPSWTDSTITAGTTLIRKVHFTELRNKLSEY